MNNIIGKFMTLGQVSECFLNSLGIKTDKTIENLAKEKDIDLERLIPEFFKKLKKLEGKQDKLIYLNKKNFVLKKEIIKEIADYYLTLSDSYITIINKYVVTIPQEKLDKILAENFFYSFTDSFTKMINNKFLDNELTDEVSNNNLTDEIFNKILLSIGKDNFGFIKTSKEDITKNCEENSLYMFTQRFKDHFSSDENINEFVEFLGKKFDLPNKTKEKFLLSLFLARFHQNIIKNITPQITKRAKQNQYDLKYLMNLTLDKLKQTPIESNVREYIFATDELRKLVDFNKTKEEGSETKVEKLYTKLIDSKNPFKYHIEHSYAKHLLMMQKPKEALNQYIKALDEGVYQAGEFLRPIIREGLVLSAHLPSKENFRRFYKYAYVNGLVAEPYKEENKWMLDQFKKEFDLTFNKNGFYPSKNVEKAKNQKSKILKTLYSIIGGPEDVKELYLKNPNRKYEFNGRKLTQLMIFSMLPAFDKQEEILYQENIKKLLAKEADVNIVNITEQTALMEAIASNNLERALILLENPKIHKTINQNSSRKKLTNLTILLEKLLSNIENNFGNVKSVLIKLLEKGAYINQTGTVGDVAPLHFLIGYFQDESIHSFIDRQIKYLEDKKDIGNLKRVMHDPMFPVHFDDEVEKMILSSVNNKDKLEFQEILINHRNKIRMLHENKLFELLNILLEKKADVNQIWRKGISPLMYSTEIGNLELFTTLLKYHPNLSQKTESGHSLITNSLVYNSFEISKYILENFEFKSINLEFISQMIFSTLDNIDITKKYKPILKTIFDLAKLNLTETELKSIVMLWEGIIEKNNRIKDKKAILDMLELI